MHDQYYILEILSVWFHVNCSKLELTFKMTRYMTAESNCRFVNLLLMLTLLMAMTAGCHGDQHDQPASRMLVFRDLPDGIEPNLAQHLIIRTGYEVLLVLCSFDGNCLSL